MDLRCSYASKPCPKPRALRRNGQPHSFCEEHRRKANDAQKRWYDRWRQTPSPVSHGRGKTGNLKSTKASAFTVEPGSYLHRRTSSAAKVRQFESQRYSCPTFQASEATVTSPSSYNDLPPPLWSEQESFAALLDFDWGPFNLEVLERDATQTVNPMVYQF